MDSRSSKRRVAAMRGDPAPDFSRRMEYEVIRDRLQPEDWRVEAIDHDGEGEVYVTIFSGSDAEARAREYAQFKADPLAEETEKLVRP